MPHWTLHLRVLGSELNHTIEMLGLYGQGLIVCVAALVGLTVGGVIGLRPAFREGRVLAIALGLLAIGNGFGSVFAPASLPTSVCGGLFGLALGLRLSRPATDRMTEVVIFIASLVLGLVGGAYATGIAPLLDLGLSSAPLVVLTVASCTLLGDLVTRRIIVRLS